MVPLAARVRSQSDHPRGGVGSLLKSRRRLPVSGVLVVAEPPAQTAARDTIGFAQIKGSGIKVAAPSPDGTVTPVEALLHYG